MFKCSNTEKHNEWHCGRPSYDFEWPVFDLTKVAWPQYLAELCQLCSDDRLRSALRQD